MKALIFVAMMIAGQLCLAVPGRNKLIAPSSVRTLQDGNLEVVFSIPCASNDSVTYVMNSDDSGDMTVAVGVVYSREVCQAHTRQTFHETVEVSRFGYTAQDGVEFVPMNVSQ